MRRWFTVVSFDAGCSGRDLLARACNAVVQELGFVATIMLQAPNEDDLSKDDVILYLVKLGVAPTTVSKATVIYYNLELLPLASCIQIDIDVPRDYYSLHLKPRIVDGVFDLILDYCEQTARFLLELGHRAVFCPPGYHECLEVGDAEPFDEGVYYLGKLYGSHRRVIMSEEQASKRWRTLNLCRRSRVVFSCGGRHVYARGKDGKATIDRSRLMVTPGVHLNINGSDTLAMTFGGIRVIQMLLTNCRFVLSEPCWWSPLANLVHWVEAPPERLPEIAGYYMDHKNEREEIAERGSEFVRKSLSMRYWLERALSVGGVI